ncbi:MAG: hypothetical protein INQ03_12845 [Candidatus Heimdallarchaeota archaeon]|nr:hypothetical protein [Candidatus Heimdallarchaeota archaeon]
MAPKPGTSVRGRSFGPLMVSSFFLLAFFGSSTGSISSSLISFAFAGIIIDLYYQYQ